MKNTLNLKNEQSMNKKLSENKFSNVENDFQNIEENEINKKKSYLKDNCSIKSNENIEKNIEYNQNKTDKENVLEYNYNVIYHSLYIELLHENNELKNEIIKLKQTIKEKNEIIKNKGYIKDIKENEKDLNKDIVKNKYFFTFFNKSKQKEYLNYIYKKTDKIKKKKISNKYYLNESNLGNKYDKIDNKDHGKKKKNIYIKLNNNEKKNFDLYENNNSVFYEHNFLSDENNLNDNENNLNDNENNKNDNVNNKNDNKNNKNDNGNNLNDNEHNKNDNVNNKNDNKNKYDNGNNKINYIIDCNNLEFWNTVIIPIIEEEKKKNENNISLNYLINYYMPIEIKNSFWKISIDRNVYITHEDINELINKAEYIENYIYRNSEKYRNYILRYCIYKKNIYINYKFNENKNYCEDINFNKNCLDHKILISNDEINGNKENNINNFEFDNYINTELCDEKNVNEIKENNEDNNINLIKDNEKGSNLNNEYLKNDKYEDILNNEKIKYNKNTIYDNEENVFKLLNNYAIENFFYQILIDLDRTIYIIKKNKEYFQTYNINTYENDFFSDINLIEIKKKLNKLLQMFVLYKPELGYVQGMSYVALIFLLYCDLEEAFIHFVNFMDRNEIYKIYSFNKEELKIYTYTIKKILLKKNIEIFKKINKHYNIDHIFIQWIFTIFFTCLPLNIFSRIFDMYTLYDNIIYQVITCIFMYLDKYYYFEKVDVLVKNLSVFAFNANINETKFWNIFQRDKIKKKIINYYRKKYFNKKKQDNYKEETDSIIK